MRREFEAMLEENDKRRRQIALEHEAKLAEHEARIEQLKQMEGDHSAEIEDEEFLPIMNARW